MKRIKKYATKKVVVVIRFVTLLDKWYICNVTTYQAAIGSGVGGFVSREGAESHAKKKGFIVTRHDWDPAQQNPRAVA